MIRLEILWPSFFKLSVFRTRGFAYAVPLHKWTGLECYLN